MAAGRSFIRQLTLNKPRIIGLLLLISLALNICGVVMAVAFFKLRASYHQAIKEKEEISRKVNASQSGTLPRETVGSLQVAKRSFLSHLDGEEDFFAVLPPSVSRRTDYILIVYLHGMGSNYMEPFVYPADESVAIAYAKRFANVVVLSCNYRKEASWGSDEAMSDITQNIREVEQQYPIKQIVLVGTSMGGCASLQYATEAPDDIRSKLAGVVSVEGAGDLSRLYATTENPYVKQAMEKAFGGKPDAVPQAYQRKSFLSNMDKLPQQARVAVVSAKQDRIVPTPLQEEIVQALQKANRPVTMISVEGGHEAPPGAVYVKGAEFVLQHN
jgi:predicted esterase